MKALLTFFVFLIFVSCVHSGVKTGNPDRIWNILENSVQESWTKEKLIGQLGQPAQILRNKNSAGEKYFYIHKITTYQEWTLEFNEKGIVSSATYIPSSDNFANFSLDNIKIRWQRFDCEEKENKSGDDPAAQDGGHQR